MRILSLDGGGYLGLATAAFLEATEHHFQTTCHEKFNFFCGTSTGAIIALGLAAGKTARDIRELYKRLGPRVFWNPLPGMKAIRFLKGFFTSRYSNRALKRALDEAFEDETIGDILANRGKRILVPAFCLTTGFPRIFKTDYASELSLHNNYRIADLAMASSAAPVYFPVYPIQAPSSGVVEEFCDGGVFANHPGVLAYGEAISHLGVPSQKVRILSVSTPRADLSRYETLKPRSRRAQLRRGFLSWSSTIASVFIDSTSFINDQSLIRLADPRTGTGLLYERFALQRPPKISMDTAAKSATKALVRVGSEAAQSGNARKRLKPFFE